MVCGLHTASSNKRKENKIKKKLTTQHVGCTPRHQTKGRKKKKKKELTTWHVGCTLHRHHPSGHLFPFYPFFSHSSESLLLSS